MNTRPFFHGGMLVLVLLVTLGLLSFGALSMMSAWSDLKLSRTAAARACEYYALEGVANEQLAALSEDEGGAFTVAFGGQNLAVTVLPGYKITEWRQWQPGFDYEAEGLELWIG